MITTDDLSDICLRELFRNYSVYIIYTSTVRWIYMKQEVDIKTIISNLTKLGVKANMTKSRLELLKVLTPPAQTPTTQA